MSRGGGAVRVTCQGGRDVEAGLSAILRLTTCIVKNLLVETEAASRGGISSGIPGIPEKKRENQGKSGILAGRERYDLKKNPQSYYTRVSREFQTLHHRPLLTVCIFELWESEYYIQMRASSGSDQVSARDGSDLGVKKNVFAPR